MNNEYAFNQYDVCFDKADIRNASLYLCQPKGVDDPGIDAVIEQLRGAGLWSASPPVVVSEAQKPAYIAQLQLLDWAAYVKGATAFLAVRFDHPNFRSDAERWRAWQELLGRRYARQDLPGQQPA